MNSIVELPARKEVLGTIESLIEVNRDGQEGYTQAAAHALEGELKDLFLSYAAERAGMVRDLQDLQRQHGKREADASGTLSGSLHRAWINLRTAIASSQDQALLEEAERSEDAALEAYRDALNPSGAPLPRSVTVMLENQLGKLLASHQDIRIRRDSGRYTGERHDGDIS